MNTSNQTTGTITQAEATAAIDTLHAIEAVMGEQISEAVSADIQAIESMTEVAKIEEDDEAPIITADAGIVEVPIASLVDTKTKTKITAAGKKAEKGPSKADTVYAMVESNFKAVAEGKAISRAEMIRKIEKEANMHNAGASTYFYNASQKVKTALGGTLPQLPRAVVASAKVAPTTPIVAAAQTTAQ